MADVPAARLEGGLWCHEVLERLDAYVDGSLPSDQRAAIEAHLAACDQCERFGGAYALLVGALRRGLGAARPLGSERARRLERHLQRILEES
ncbi:MAG TPA: hypothetical protein ENK18_03240 [Deltaproteobacteria bacterium]|nr:hypothetical protein [Deltaproteobacteria bacterium]